MKYYSSGNITLHTAWPQKSLHMGLSKQTCVSSLLDDYCQELLPQLRQQGASHFLNNLVKDTSCHLGKYVLRTIHCKFSRVQDLGLSPSYV